MVPVLSLTAEGVCEAETSPTFNCPSGVGCLGLGFRSMEFYKPFKFHGPQGCRDKSRGKGWTREEGLGDC